MHRAKTHRGIASTMAGAAAVAGLLLAAGCAVDRPVGVTELPGIALAVSDNAVTNVPKITGSVEIVWKGGNGAGAPDVENRAFAEFEGFEMPAGMAPRGSFHFLVYRVTPEGLMLHREIEAAATGVVIDPVNHKAWMTAEVIADTKQCMSGGGCDGHDGGDGGMGGPGGCTDCGGDTGHDGGCSGSDDGTHDGGCEGGSGGMGGMEGGSGGMEGGTGGTEGGCSGSGGTTDTDGGCAGDDTSHDGGCGGSDGTSGGCSGDDTSHDGGCAGGGSGGSGGHVSGSGSRVGQFLAIKMHDGDTPAVDGDGITWKWFAAGAAPQILDIAGVYPDGYADEYKWPHLCKKTILGGNLMIHPPTMP